MTYKPLATELKEGDVVLIDDGRISLRVTGLTDTDVITKVEIGGKISTHKGVNIPNVSLDMPYISKQDASDLLFGIEQGVDFVSASFVRKKEDVIEPVSYTHLSEKRAELDDAIAKISENEQKIADGEAEYEKSRADAEAEDVYKRQLIARY